MTGVQAMNRHCTTKCRESRCRIDRVVCPATDFAGRRDHRFGCHISAKTEVRKNCADNDDQTYDVNNAVHDFLLF
jgi:hypothetical protein